MKRKIAIVTLFMISMVILLPGCIFLGEPQIAAFQSSPESITAGEAVDLVWAVVGAQSVSISPNLGNVPLAGSRQVYPNQTTTYTITARNASGTSSASLTVTVKPAVNIVRFEANPAEINSGSSSTLQWNVVGASSVSIYPDVGTVATVGSRTVSPSITSTYTLTAISGSQVITRSAIVTVRTPPVVAQFTAAPSSIDLGQSTTLTWTVSGANEITIEPDLGTVPASGSRVVSPNRTTVYVLSASSDCCVVDRNVTVQVSQLPPTAYLPIVTLFNISPNSIYSGDSATLQWSVFNANSVVINHGIGSVAPSGSITVSPSNSTVYTLSASNSYGYRQVSVGIIVLSP